MGKMILDDLRKRLERLDEDADLMIDNNDRYQMVIVGGSAFILLGKLTRATHDIDALNYKVDKPDPFMGAERPDRSAWCIHLCPAVRHAAAGRDAAVAHLNRFSQPGKLCTGEGIHSHHCRRLDLFADRLNQFRRLHAGLPQHAAGEDTNRAQLRQIGKFLFGQRRPEMACRQNLRPFGALYIAENLFGLKNAIILRIAANVFGSLYAYGFDQLFRKITTSIRNLFENNSIMTDQA